MSNCNRCDFKCKQNQSLNEDYINGLKRGGEKRIEAISKILKKKIISDSLINDKIKNNAVAMVTGSDGRLENIPCGSGLDITIISMVEKDGAYIPMLLTDVMNSWLEKFNEKSLESLIYGTSKVVCDTLSFDQANNLIFYQGNHGSFFPTRLIDSQFVYGNKMLFDTLKFDFFDYIKKTNSKTLDIWRNKVRSAKNITLNGSNNWKGEILRHFDKTEGIIYYKKTIDTESGIKIGPMRYVQYKIAWIFMKAIKKGFLEFGKYIDYPYFTCDRINYFDDNKIINISPMEKYELIIAYYAFVKIHHNLQKLYKKNPKDTFIYELDPTEKQEFINHIENTIKILKKF